MGTCSLMVREWLLATSARVHARALCRCARCRGWGEGGEEGKSLTLYLVTMRVLYVYVSILHLTHYRTAGMLMVYANDIV